MSTLRIPLQSRKYPDVYALIDERDLELVRDFVWMIKVSSGLIRYAYAPIPKARRHEFDNRSDIPMHHLILGLHPGQIADHKDRDGLNNTRANLRHATILQNIANAKTRSTCKSGFKGVQRNKRTDLKKPWLARIRVGDHYELCKYFETAEEAARAYDDVAKRLYGEFARLNFPPDPCMPPQAGGQPPVAEGIRTGRTFREQWLAQIRFQVDPPEDVQDCRDWTASARFVDDRLIPLLGHGTSAMIALKSLIDQLDASPPES